MSVEAALLLSISCLLLGIGTAIGYYYIYKGYKQFKLRNLLRRNGQTIDAEITNKWTNTIIKSENEKTKTKYWISYSFCYQNNQFEINHNMPNKDYYITVYDSLQIGEYISILFYAKNPSKYNLPSYAMNYSMKKYLFKILIGICISLFAIFFSILLIYLFYGNLNGFVSGFNVTMVLMGYPFLIFVFKNTVCIGCLNNIKSNKSQQENKQTNEENNTNQTSTIIVDQVDETQQFVEK